MDRLDFMEKQLSMLTREMKDKIRAMVEDVEVISSILCVNVRAMCEQCAHTWFNG